MSNTISVVIEDIEEQLLTFDRLRLYRSNTPESVTPNALLVEETPLVADQQIYTIVDTSGEPRHWYGYTLASSLSAVESGISSPWRTEALTLRTARLAAGREAGAAFESVTTGAGDASHLVDVVLLDDGVDASYQEGVWLYRPDAVLAADRVRTVRPNGFDPDAGSWEVSRSWQNPPQLGEVYQVFRFMPPIDWPGRPHSWDRSLRDAFRDLLPYTDQVFLDIGNGRRRQFNLDAYPFVNPWTLRHVWLSTTDGQDVTTTIDALHYGQNWNIIPTGPGIWTLEFREPPYANQEVWLEVKRTPDLPYRDDDVITGVALEAVAVATAMKALVYMGPAFAQEAEAMARKLNLIYKAPEPVVIGLW